MRTPEKPYDVKPDHGNLLAKHRQLPFKRFMDLIRSKLDDLNDLLKRPTPYDQGPGRIIPYAIPVLFGPLVPTTARRAGAADGVAGFETLAPLANSSAYVVPRAGDILIDREFSFRVNSMSVWGFLNWGYSADPTDFNVPVIKPVGDIFDNVLVNNGGAMPMDFFGGTFSTLSTPQPNLPNISFDLEFYDRLRGRRMHDKRIPSEMLQGGRIASRSTASPLVFEKGSKIEPRLFVKEIRMGSILDTEASYTAASVKAWVCVVLKGEQHIEIPNL